MAKKETKAKAAKSKKAAPKSAGRADDFRGKTSDELSTQLSAFKKEQFNLRFQKASGQLQDTARVRVVRRDIARVMTVAAQKRAGAKAKD